MWSAVNGCGCNACSDATEVLVRRESASSDARYGGFGARRW